MSIAPADARKLQADYDRLVTRFVAPLSTGGTVEIGRPFAPSALDYFEHASPSSAESELGIFDALHRGASAITDVSTIPWPSRDLLAIAVAMHDLLFLTDPALDRLFARGARKIVLAWVDRLIASIGPPATRGDALARHALFEAFLALRRTDTVVKNWAYTYRFFGRRVPANVIALPRLRQVQQSASEVDVLALFAETDRRGGLELGPRLRALIARSPVTELIAPERHAGFRFGAAGLRVLSDPRLRGGLARAVAARGPWPSVEVLAAALEALQPPLRSIVLRWMIEIEVTAALDPRGGAPIPDAVSPAVARYAALLPSWIASEHGARWLSALDSADRVRVERRAERLRGLAGSGDAARHAKETLSAVALD